MKTETIKVLGYCPMGCGETLAVSTQPGSDVAAVTCRGSGCPDRRAMEKIMRTTETEHVVSLTRGGFTVTHPLRERLGFGLDACVLHEWLQRTRPEEADVPGRYRVTPDNGGWRFVLLARTEMADE